MKKNKVFSNNEIAIYKTETDYDLNCYLVSTEETRKICNDPFVVGIEYTELLKNACSKSLKSLAANKLLNLSEKQSTVLHILRGGLNFGLREALSQAYSWNQHGSAFISAQRQRVSEDSEDWLINENDYCKMFLKQNNDIIFGDVVATGTSLEYALEKLANSCKDRNIDNLVFFTIGGIQALKAINNFSKRIPVKNINIIYFEGIFQVPDLNSNLSIKITGTDLVRVDSLMPDEFIQSQYENPCYPIERCTIYDAGSRAFHIEEYLEDLQDYWSKNLELAESGMTYSQLLKERFPSLTQDKFLSIDLKKLCQNQLNKISNF